MRRIFDPDNLFFRFLGRGVDIVGLSVLWAALCVPVVTAGPATAALYFTLVKEFRHNSEEEPFHLFFRSFRQNLRVGIPASLICAAAIAVLCLGYRIMRLQAATQTGVLLYMAYYVALLLPIGILSYVFPLLGRFEFSLRDLFRTAGQLAVLHLPSTVVVGLLGVETAVAILDRWWPVLFAPAAAALLASLFLERVFQKHLPEEEHPEGA